PPDYPDFYRQSTADPKMLEPLLTNGNVFRHREAGNGVGSLELTYVGASDNLSHVFFSANDALTSEAGEPGEKTNLYESSDTAVAQVNLAPSTGTPLPGAVFGSGTLLES